MENAADLDALCLNDGATGEDVIQQPDYDRHSASINISGQANVQFGNTYYSTSSESKDRQATLLDSLSFPEMFNRYSAIEDEHYGTFEWALTQENTDKWDSFAAWLKDEKRIYWISGKPGSGKSTLMKYLFSNVAESEASRHSLVISFWFWEAGSSLEKNLSGCLKSLLWQCLKSPHSKEIPDLVATVAHTTLLHSTRSLANLLKECLRTLQAKGIYTKVFLDGIDECGSEIDGILEFVDDLAHIVSRVKLCVSSRLESVLVDALGLHPKLRLQDLTSKDIEKVIDDEFITKPRVVALLKHKPRERNNLRYMLKNNAEGVFLWVRLVIRSLLQGLSDRDTLEVLTKRLKSLPSDLDKLYDAMLSRNKHNMSYYRETAALYFSVALHRPMTIIEFYLATEEGERAKLLDPSCDVEKDGISAIRWDDVRIRIPARTGGFLEVYDLSAYPDLLPAIYTGSMRSLGREQRTSVEFIHRTARDYLLSTAKGVELLSSSGINSSSLSRICFETRLVQQTALCWLDKGSVTLRGGYMHDINCHVCKEPTAADVQSAERIWRHYHNSRRLQTDDNLILYMHEVGRKVSYPLREDGTIDLTRTYCRLGWCTHVQRIVADSPLQMTCREATALFLEAVEVYQISLYFTDLTFHEMEELSNQVLSILRCLEDHGTDFSLSVCIIDGAEKSFWSVLLTYFASIYQSGFIDDNKVAFDELLTTVRPTANMDLYSFESSIAGIDFDHTETYTSRSGFTLSFWGSFGFTDVFLQTLHGEPIFISSYPELHHTQTSSRIYVVRCSHPFWFTEDFPVYQRHEAYYMYGISEADSTALLTWLRNLVSRNLAQREKAYHVEVTLHGILRMYSVPPGDLSDPFIEEISDMIQRIVVGKGDRLHSLSEALLFIGKSQESIDRYVSDKETMLRQIPGSEAKIAQLKARFAVEPSPNVAVTQAAPEIDTENS